MAKKNDTRFFENKLLDFVVAKDPLLEMLQWVMDKFMEIEVARKTGAPKGSHSQGRTGYRCGYRVRRFDTRLGTVYLSVPKIRQGGYIPFFVAEKKRSEQALIQVVQYNELLCQHKKIHRFKVYKLYSLFVFQFIALEGFIHFIRYTVI